MSPRPHLPPSIIAADEAPAYWRIGILWNVILPADVTSGEFTMMDQTMPAGTGPPPHVHERYDEGFYILDGAIEYTVDTDEGELSKLAEQGAAVWIPRGTRHSFEIKTESSRALNFYTPGGFDESISLLASPATERIVPPPGSGEDDPTSFMPRADRQSDYLARIAALHSQSMP